VNPYPKSGAPQIDLPVFLPFSRRIEGLALYLPTAKVPRADRL
jgi:hypothetical protein